MICLPHTLPQDLMKGLGWVSTAVEDVRNVLLELDDDDLNELAQVGLLWVFPINTIFPIF